MVVVDNLEDFVRLNDKDVERIMHKVHPRISSFYNLEDVKQHLYLTFHRKNIIGKWDIARGGSFNTFIYKCISNFITAYYRKKNQEIQGFESCLSLDFSILDDSKFYDCLADSKDNLTSSDIRLRLSKAVQLLEAYQEGRTDRVLEMSTILREYAAGSSDKEIAVKHKTSIANVSMMRKKMAKLILRMEKKRHIRGSFEPLSIS